MSLQTKDRLLYRQTILPHTPCLLLSPVPCPLSGVPLRPPVTGDQPYHLGVDKGHSLIMGHWDGISGWERRSGMVQSNISPLPHYCWKFRICGTLNNVPFTQWEETILGWYHCDSVNLTQWDQLEDWLLNLLRRKKRDENFQGFFIFHRNFFAYTKATVFEKLALASLAEQLILNLTQTFEKHWFLTLNFLPMFE